MIASSMVSVNYLDMYIKHFLYEQNIPSYNQIMSSVQWNSVITRYYEETIFNPEDSKNEKISNRKNVTRISANKN